MNSHADKRILLILQQYVRFVCALSVVAGLAVLLGWAFDIARLKSPIPGFAEMKPLTASSILLIGAALWHLRDEKPYDRTSRLGPVYAGIAAIVAGVILLEYIFALDFGIDRWLFREAIMRDGGLYPGRPSPAAAFSLFFISLALFASRRRWMWAISILILPVLLISLLATVGYAFGVSSLYQIEPYSSIALHTALLLFLIALAIVFAFPRHSLTELFLSSLAGGKLTRRLILAAVLIPFALAWLRLQGELLGLYDPRFGLALDTTLNIVIFASLILLNARLLNNADLHRETVLAALRETETKYRMIVEQTPAIVYVDEIEDRWRYLSPQVERILGYGAQEWLADPGMFKSRIHPDDAERVYQQIAKSKSTGEPFVSEYRFLTREGKVIWLRDEAVLIPEESTGKTILQGVMFDITERRQVESELRKSEERYRTLIEQLPIVVYTNPVDNLASTSYVSPQINSFLGYTQEEWTNDPQLWSKRVHPEDLRRVMAEVERTQRTGEPFDMEYRILARDGHALWIRDQAILLRDEQGTPLFWQGLMIDRTESRQAEEVLERANAQLELRVMERTADLKEANERLSIELAERARAERELAIYSQNLGILYALSQQVQANPNLDRVYQDTHHAVQKLMPCDSFVIGLLEENGRQIEAVYLWDEDRRIAGETHPIGSDLTDYIISSRKPLIVDDWNETHAKMTQSSLFGNLEEGIQSVLAVPLFKTDGACFGMISARAYPAHAYSTAHEQLLTTLAAQISHVIESAQLRENLRQQSIRDPLTGLFNRRFLQESMELELHRATRDHSPLGVIMLDIDHFKKFNDTFGHGAGDTLLRELARLFLAHVRVEDIVCRYGGEEFAIILLGMSQEAALERAQALCEQARRLKVHYQEQSLGTITLSLGVAVFPRHGENSEALLHAADSALYRAKRSGRDCVVLAGKEDKPRPSQPEPDSVL